MTAGTCPFCGVMQPFPHLTWCPRAEHRRATRTADQVAAARRERLARKRRPPPRRRRRAPVAPPSPAVFRLPSPSLGWRALACATLLLVIFWGVDAVTRRPVPEPADPHAFQIEAYRPELGPRHTARPLESLAPEDYITSDDIEE